jgi:1,4-dihydroxy-2-naphthoate octaprenyltransferase
MLENYFESISPLVRNERVKLAAMFWNNVGAGMLIGGVAGAFYLQKPLFWSKFGIAIVGIALAVFCYSVGNRMLGYLRTP